MEEKIAILAIAALPALLGIALHEAAHAYAARYFGDPTAERLGRISLNPLRHIDPVGTVLLPSLLFLSTGFLFGYAKPVPVDFRRLRHPKRDMLWVAAAGPAANLFMALGWAFFQMLLVSMPASGYSQALMEMSYFGILINLVLCFLNLIPLPPLDGGRIVTSLLPMPLARHYVRLEPFGLVILVLLLMSGLLGFLLGPLVTWAFRFLRFLFPLS
ncbi:MAG: site-2 protease family protein [Zoogloeaceae bacterium]|jgi:Zn-dependent protease|nr:site-2 protease family protein [Zoogloeaceae bacterium]